MKCGFELHGFFLEPKSAYLEALLYPGSLKLIAVFYYRELTFWESFDSFPRTKCSMIKNILLTFYVPRFLDLSIRGFATFLGFGSSKNGIISIVVIPSRDIWSLYLLFINKVQVSFNEIDELFLQLNQNLIHVFYTWKVNFK